MSLSSQIRHDHNDLFVLCYELKKLMAEMMMAAPTVVTPKDGVAYYLMTKVYRTFGNVIRLTKDGSTEDAEMLARTTFEAYVTFANILMDETEDTAMKYLEYDDVTRARMYKIMKDRKNFSTYFAERLEHPEEGDEAVEDIEARAADWKEKHKATNLNQWHSPKKAGEMAAAVDMYGFHTTAYVMESHLVHSLPRAMNRYLSLDSGYIVMDLEPKGHEAGMALITGFEMAFGTAENFNAHFKLGHEAVFGELATRFKATVKEK